IFGQLKARLDGQLYARKESKTYTFQPTSDTPSTRSLPHLSSGHFYLEAMASEDLEKMSFLGTFIMVTKLRVSSKHHNKLLTWMAIAEEEDFDEKHTLWWR
ncbi:hypothetical protein MAR_021580, partial [Mya arenaria]